MGWMDSDEPRSVRIEFDDSSSSPVAPSVGGSPGPPKRGALILGAIAVICAVGLVVLLRPAEDETADGSIRQSTTTTIMSPSTTSPASTSTTTLGITTSARTSLLPTVGLSEFESIVRSDSLGFLALQWEEAENGPPRVSRSDDGVNWTQVSTSLDSGSDAAGAVILRDYDWLISTDSGFALLMSTIRLVGGAAGAPLFETVRLTSPDGVQWTRDPTFEVVTGVDFARPIGHSSDAVVVFQLDKASDLSSILERAVGSDVIIEIPCSATPSSGVGPLLLIDYCDATPPTVVGPADLVDPERFAELSECIQARNDGAIGSNTIAVVREGRPRIVLSQIASLSITPTIFDDGSVVIIDRDGQPENGSPCSGFLDAPEVQPPSLIRWNTNTGEVERLPLPIEIATDLYDLRASPKAAGTRLLVALDSSVWAADILTGEWFEVVEIPNPGNGSPINIELLNDEGDIMVLATDLVGVSRAQSNDQDREWGWVGFDARLTAPVIRYGDEQIAIISSVEGTFALDSPSQN